MLFENGVGSKHVVVFGDKKKGPGKKRYGVVSRGSIAFDARYPIGLSIDNVEYVPEDDVKLSNNDTMTLAGTKRSGFWVIISGSRKTKFVGLVKE